MDWFGIGVEFHKDENGHVTIRDCHWIGEDDNPIGGIDSYFTPPAGTDDFRISVPGGEITMRNGHLMGIFLMLSKSQNTSTTPI